MTGIFEIASRLSTPLALGGFVFAVVFFVFRQILQSDRFPTLTKALSSEIYLTIINRLFVLALVAMVLGFIGFVLPDPDTLYTVRVNVVDANGDPVDDAVVQSTVGGEPQRIQGGWQFRIPEEQVPATRQVTFRARQANAFLRGQETITLGKDYGPTVEIALAADTSARISGLVTDENDAAVAGATVFVVGHDGEAVSTSETGGFSLAAHVAEGQQVQVRAQRAGYRSVTEWHPAGPTPIMLRLQKESP